MLAPPHILPRFIPYEIGRNCKQPGPLVLYRILPQRPHERLLSNFLRRAATSQPPRQVSRQRGVVRSEESLDVRHSITSGPVTLPGRDPTGALHPTQSARLPCCDPQPIPVRRSKTPRGDLAAIRAA